MKEVSLWLSLDDLIFEHRNKLYGAYVLRKEYPQRIAIATVVVISLLLLLIPISDQLRKNAAMAFDDATTDRPDGTVILSDYILPPPPAPTVTPPVAPVAPVTPPATKPTTGRTVVPVIDNGPEVATTSTEIVNVEGGLSTSATGGTDVITGPVTGTGVAGADSGTGTVAAPAGPYIHDYAEKRPQYPGGDAALFKKLSSMIRYPEEAYRQKVSGTVLVSFVVDPKGNVSQVKVMKGIGGGCDEEAVRVISKLNGWSPALQHGHPVFFKYVLPVRFAL